MKTVHGKTVCETIDEVLAPQRCAVLAIDIQNDAMRLNGKLAAAGHDLSGMQRILPRCASFIAGARALGIPVFHSKMVTLPDGRSDSPGFIRAKDTIAAETEFFLEGTWGAEICEECAPAEGEIVITKRRSSAFHRTELDMLLRANGVETVVLIGEQTPGCVDSTLRDATAHDYYTVLVEDCIAGLSQELHEAALEIQRGRTDVVTADEVLNVWRAAAEAVSPPPSPRSQGQEAAVRA